MFSDASAANMRKWRVTGAGGITMRLLPYLSRILYTRPYYLSIIPNVYAKSGKKSRQTSSFISRPGDNRSELARGIHYFKCQVGLNLNFWFQDYISTSMFRKTVPIINSVYSYMLPYKTLKSYKFN